MKFSATTTLGRSSFILSLRILVFALVASFLVFAALLGLQWVVYEDLLHRAGPLRITGTSFAAVLTFAFIWRWQSAERARQREVQKRLEVISQMNDRIRNALQIIQVTSYVSQPNATAPIREAVDTIDAALREASAGVISLLREGQGSQTSEQILSPAERQERLGAG